MLVPYVFFGHGSSASVLCVEDGSLVLVTQWCVIPVSEECQFEMVGNQVWRKDRSSRLPPMDLLAVAYYKDQYPTLMSKIC